MITYNAEMKITINYEGERDEHMLAFDEMKEALKDLPHDIQACLNCEFDEFQFKVESVSDELVEN